jgi:hypothetical protein
MEKTEWALAIVSVVNQNIIGPDGEPLFLKGVGVGNWLMQEANNIGWCFWTYKRVDTERSVVSIRRTDEWDAIAAFAEHPRSNYAEIREQRPPRAVVDQAFGDFLWSTLNLHSIICHEMFFQVLEINTRYAL